MSKTMLVRSAKAIAEEGGWDWATLGAETKGHYERQARAVLTALREPDEGMLKASAHALNGVPKQTIMDATLAQGYVLCDLKTRVRWQAMIDAILSEGKSE